MSMTTEKKIKFIFKLDKMGLPLRMKQISSIKYVCVFNQIQLKLLYSEIFERDFNRDNHCFIQSTGFYCSYCCCLLYGNGWSLCIAFNVRQSIVNIGRTEKKRKKHHTQIHAPKIQFQMNGVFEAFQTNSNNSNIRVWFDLAWPWYMCNLFKGDRMILPLR